MPSGLHHRANMCVLARGQAAFDAKLLGIAQDAVERRAQFMRYHGDEPRFGLAGFFRCIPRSVGLGLGNLAGHHLSFKGEVQRREIGQRAGEALL